MPRSPVLVGVVSAEAQILRPLRLFHGRPIAAIRSRQRARRFPPSILHLAEDGALERTILEPTAPGQFPPLLNDMAFAPDGASGWAFTVDALNAGQLYLLTGLTGTAAEFLVPAGETDWNGINSPRTNRLCLVDNTGELPPVTAEVRWISTAGQVALYHGMAWVGQRARFQPGTRFCRPARQGLAVHLTGVAAAQP